MRRLLVVACACVIPACGKSTQKRTDRDAAAVQVVTQPVIGDGGTGPATDEVEPNDGDDTATALALGATVRAKIEPETDVDTFKIAVTETGALAVDVSGIDGVDLILEIEDVGGTVLAKSDRGGVRIKEGVPNLGVSPGTYRAVVKMKKAPPPKATKPKKGQKPIDAGIEVVPAPVYEISARMAPPAANAEREPDDDRGTAQDLIVGDAVTGFIGWSGDADVWKLSVETLSEKNAIDIEVGAVEGVALSIDVSDGIGNPLVTRKGPRGQPLVVRGIVPIVPDGAPPFHYVTIRADKSNPETPYQLRVVAKIPQPDAEIEPNDAPEKAMPVPTDRTVVHGVWTRRLLRDRNRCSGAHRRYHRRRSVGERPRCRAPRRWRVRREGRQERCSGVVEKLAATARTAEGMPNLGLGRGDYLVTVRAFVKAARKPPPRTKPRKGEPRRPTRRRRR